MPTLADNRLLRLATLCMLYVAQGIPFGFISRALKNELAGNGVDLAQTGEVLSFISVPFTIKFIWGPIMDRWGYKAMGRRRPWILTAQLALVVSLAVFAFSPGVSALSIGWLAAMVFCVNLFASMQDVAVDALAVDLLPENERGRVSALMFGSSYIGTWFGAFAMPSLVIGVKRFESRARRPRSVIRRRTRSGEHCTS
ncbi:MAG: MFS transporter [Verrucomicrobiota bacterium]